MRPSRQVVLSSCGLAAVAVLSPVWGFELVDVFTSDTTARIPDLAAQGMGLPPGASHQWAVLGFAPFSNVDAFAAHHLRCRG